MRYIDADILKRKMLGEIASRSADTAENRIANAWIKKFVETIDDQETAETVPKFPRGIYECFHCGSYGVSWDADFDFADYGYEGEGIIHNCHCNNCGAEIQYFISCGDEEEQDD